jgi:hypothetical protein
LRRALQNVQPHVLEGVFGIMHAVEHLAQVIAQARLVPFHEFGKRGGVSGLAPEHQELLVEPIRVIGHSGLGLPRELGLYERVAPGA